MKVLKSNLFKKIQEQNSTSGVLNKMIASQNSVVEVKVDGELKKVSTKVVYRN